MEHRIVTKEAFKIIGVKYLSTDNSTTIPETWNKFNRRYREIADRSITIYALGVCIPTKNGEFSYIASFEVDNIENPPEGMISEIIPAQKYVVFTHKGPIDNIGKTMENIYGGWLKQLALDPVEGPDFELYDERFDPFNPSAPNNEIDIYIPIK